MQRSVDGQLDVISRGIVDLHVAAELRKKVERSVATGVPLRVKAGFDPTAPDLHLGHTVLIHKMRRFQELGHQVIFLIGDFTGMIGDPTGKSVTRPALSREGVLRNAETYKRQVFKILDPERTEVRFNSEWMDGLGAAGLINLAGRYTVARMLERDDFKKRYEGERPISVHELLYPLVQGYDSVALKADVELGGTDQLFNLLVGRHLMSSYGLEPQVIMTTPILEGTDARMEDGKLVGNKMSKSLGNYIGIDEAPKEIFGKVMSISDDLMWRYYELLSDLASDEIAGLRAAVREGAQHPKKVKVRLAKELVARFHTPAAADDAEREFDAVFAKGELPDDIAEATLEAESTEGVALARALHQTQCCGSVSDAKRLIQQGGVAVDDHKVTSIDARLAVGGPYLIKAGKRQWRRISVRTRS